MDTTMRFTEADRDEAGFIRVRPLAELLPEPPAPAEPPEPAAATAEPTAPAPRRRWPVLDLTRPQLTTAIGAALGLLLAALLIYAIGAAVPAAPRVAPTTAPTIPASPVPSPVPPTAAPPIAAYWGPGGERAPDIAAGTVFTPTATYGDTWVSVELPGGGHVWIGANDAGTRGSLPDALPDLAAPSPAPPPPQSPPRPVANPQAPASAPAQPPCQEFGVPGRLVTVCGWGDLRAEGQRAWAEQYGGHIGQPGQPGVLP